MVNMTVNGQAKRYTGAYVTEDFLKILGVAPAQGRDFTADDNRPGADGSIGSAFAAKAPADGYTILLADAPHTINALVYSKQRYDAIKDFTPLAGMCEVPLVMMASNAVNARDAAELFDTAQPGRLQ
mgnify:CR=1 FL=1